MIPLKDEENSSGTHNSDDGSVSDNEREGTNGTEAASTPAAEDGEDMGRLGVMVWEVVEWSKDGQWADVRPLSVDLRTPNLAFRNMGSRNKPIIWAIRVRKGD